MTTTLSERIVGVLGTGDAAAKAHAARLVVADWWAGNIPDIGYTAPPIRPNRPKRPELLQPKDMQRRGRAQTKEGRIALLHAIAHIELNAVDLAADILVRFSNAHPPLEFYNDWLSVLNDEAKHFLLLFDRLSTLGATYGDLPAHDGLWEAAQETSHDLLARLAVVPLVLEARGLDVTPQIISSLEMAGDTESVAILEVIYCEEISHVAVGRKWFEYFCDGRPEQTWQRLVKKHFRGSLKPPFNVAARSEAGFNKKYYGSSYSSLSVAH
ncbi:MAG: ferritin-like domain-containing protein [Pseudomonadota bacterium]|nr:ferritin-like domain-containing protein [Pseudomonadota bacterium]